MNSLDFCSRYLPAIWAERDLQLLIQKRLRRYWLKAPDEVQVKTPASLRRIDIATWMTVYEVKKWLTRDNIFHAVAQTELYTHYGTKMFWVIRKRRVILGLAPTEPMDYEQAVRVARDFRKMGIEVIFINETGLDFPIPEVGAIMILIGLVAMLLAIALWAVG
ncbi:hypothetical protein [Scytonema sp. PCC 10023]|uniref:hypothetical protein n=1 Tax=Scytonema sp. PCC 10023 TaxID=1680591 RepID=UPI0039C6433C